MKGLEWRWRKFPVAISSPCQMRKDCRSVLLRMRKADGLVPCRCRRAQNASADLRIFVRHPKRLLQQYRHIAEMRSSPNCDRKVPLNNGHRAQRVSSLPWFRITDDIGADQSCQTTLHSFLFGRPYRLDRLIRTVSKPSLRMISHHLALCKGEIARSTLIPLPCA